MQNDMSSGLKQSNLTLNFEHHEKGSLMSLKDFQVAFAECLATFFLVFLIGASKNNVATSHIHPYAIGFGLCALVYTFGPISGGQMNPSGNITL